MADEEITRADFIVHDKVTETKKPRSSVENGRYWLTVKSEMGFKHDAEVARYLDLPESTVRDCIRVSSIDSKYLALAYEPSVLGKPQAEKIRKFDTLLNTSQFELLKQKRDKFVEDNSEKFSTLDRSVVNGRVIDHCLVEALALLEGGKLLSLKNLNRHQ